MSGLGDRAGKASGLGVSDGSAHRSCKRVAVSQHGTREDYAGLRERGR